MCVVAAASMATAFNANGQSLEATLVQVTPFLNVQGTFDGGVNTSTDISGTIQFTTTGAESFDFETFCVQPLVGVSIGQTLTYEVTDTSLLPNADKIALLAGGYLASLQTAADSAAVQWAIWEIRAETSGTYDLTAGTVSIDASSASTATLANNYLSQINTFTPAPIVYLTNANYQDMVAFGGGVNQIPEPTSMGLLLVSSAMLLRRKRK